jgi:hypothetical protein
VTLKRRYHQFPPSRFKPFAFQSNSFPQVSPLCSGHALEASEVGPALSPAMISLSQLAGDSQSRVSRETAGPNCQARIEPDASESSGGAWQWVRTTTTLMSCPSISNQKPAA